MTNAKIPEGDSRIPLGFKNILEYGLALDWAKVVWERRGIIVILELGKSSRALPWE